MGARDRDGLGRDIGDATRHLAIGVDGGGDPGLPPPPDAGDDQGRMRDGEGGHDGHAIISSVARLHQYSRFRSRRATVRPPPVGPVRPRCRMRPGVCAETVPAPRLVPFMHTACNKAQEV